MRSNHDLDQKLKEELRKNLLCSGLAGEIQQIAQGIILARETVEFQTKNALPEAYSAYIGPALRDMDICVRYLSYISENLADLTIRSQGRLNPRLQPVDLAWQWNQLVDLVRDTETPATRVSWLCECEEGRFVLADQTWADKVFLNLLMNSLRYTEGPVWAELRDLGGEGMVLCVRDGGPGLSPQLMARLFEPFVNDATGERGRHGVGLGLYLAREYSLAMGWRFELESGPKGTCVKLFVPAGSEDSGHCTTLRSQPADLALRVEQDKRVRAAQSSLLV